MSGTYKGSSEASYLVHCIPETSRVGGTRSDNQQRLEVCGALEGFEVEKHFKDPRHCSTLSSDGVLHLT